MDRLYRLSEVAKEVGVPRSTIQFYQQIGLIDSCARTPGGFRLFSYGAIEKMRTILKLRDDNMSVEQIKKYFKEMRLV